MSLLTDRRAGSTTTATTATGRPRLRRVGLPASVSAVVFDCDGLLVDTERPWHRATAALLRARGRPYAARHRAILTGRTLDDIGATLSAVLQEDAGALVEELLDRVRLEHQDAPRLMPGALRLVRRLEGRVPLAVASNSGRTMLDASLERTGLARSFPVTVSADDVVRPKPDPLPYLAAFARLGVDPTRAVVLEDSVVGATAARASGAFVVAVPSTRGGEPPADLRVRSLTARSIRAWSPERDDD